MTHQTRRGYNHLDPLDRQRPLPIRVRELGELPTPPGLFTARALVPMAGRSPLRFELRTDSTHLALFFGRNWPGDESDAPPDAAILALRNSPEDYNLPPELAQARWYCPRTRRVWMAGNQYYGNLKITVRGLSSELAPDDEMFLHGSALRIHGRGVILCGMSGAGKTTLTREILSLCGDTSTVVNDDWGPLSLSTGLLATTGEPHLHMKYSSIRTLAPELTVSPETHLSENFLGDASDSRARLLIRPGEVFGDNRIAQSAEIHLFAVIIRGEGERPSLRTFAMSDLELLETGQRSTFYQRTEHFLNGSLFLTDEARRRRTLDQHRRLIRTFRSVLLNNAGHPAEGARLLLEALQTEGRKVGTTNAP